MGYAEKYNFKRKYKIIREYKIILSNGDQENGNKRKHYDSSLKENQ